MSTSVAVAKPALSKNNTARENIIIKAVKKIKSPIDDYEKSLKLIDKHKLPTAYGVVGSDFVHGAASSHDKKINIKQAYTPNTVAKRTLQRAVLGGLMGAGYSYYSGHRNEELAKDAGSSALMGAAIGATAGPAAFYLAGKTIEAIRNRKSKQKDKNE